MNRCFIYNFRQNELYYYSRIDSIACGFQNHIYLKIFNEDYKNNIKLGEKFYG